MQTNGQSSKFAQHILNTAHNYSTMDQTMEMLHVERKGPMLHILENFAYCNGFAQSVSRQRLGKHGQRATVEDVSQ
jgi:hypothetical protein